MILSTNMIKIYDVYGVKNMLDVLSKAGMQGLDFNNDIGKYYTNEYGEEFYKDIKNYANKKGITICQAHAPFPSSYVEEEKSEIRFNEIVQAMKNASYLGAPIIVVHPCCHLDYSVENNAEILFEYNLNFYKRLVPYAQEYNIKIAIENIERVSVTSTPERLIRLYDALNSPVFTICFDVGHCLIQNVDAVKAVETLGYRLVNGCTHVHDNYCDKDRHNLPFLGNTDWEGLMKALADIGYEGNLSYESAGFIKYLATPLIPDALEYMAKVGHYLISRFKYYKEIGRNKL